MMTERHRDRRELNALARDRLIGDGTLHGVDERPHRRARHRHGGAPAPGHDRSRLAGGRLPRAGDRLSSPWST